MVAIFDLSLPVTSDSTDNMDDKSSKLNDLGSLEVAIGVSTILCPQVNVQCASDLAVAILDVSLRLLPTALTAWMIRPAS